MTEAQHRFLREIATRVPAERVVELRLFPTLRQGRVESGVAVLASEGQVVLPDAGEAPTTSEEGAASGESADGGTPRGLVTERYSILTAHYQLTLKGPDRGKWEFSLVHDADAPLEALEQVVRGVARRVGDAGEPELLSATEFQRVVSEPWWSATA